MVAGYRLGIEMVGGYRLGIEVEHYLIFLQTFTERDPLYVWMREEAQKALEELGRGR